MRFEWEGKQREVDISAVSMAQAFVIKDATKDDAYPGGRSLLKWQQGISESDPHCLRAFYWLMLQQEGVVKVCVQLEFDPLKFAESVIAGLEAEQAEEEARMAREKAERERAAAPPVPTRPAVAPSLTPGSLPDTTPELLVPSQPVLTAAG